MEQLIYFLLWTSSRTRQRNSRNRYPNQLIKIDWVSKVWDGNWPQVKVKYQDYYTPILSGDVCELQCFLGDSRGSFTSASRCSLKFELSYVFMNVVLSNGQQPGLENAAYLGSVSTQWLACISTAVRQDQALLS